MAINAEKFRWASNEVIDGTTGLSNKVEPSTSYKNSGQLAGEPVPRQYLNFMFDEQHEALVNLQGQIDALVLDAGAGVISQIFPVGAYYITESATNPATILGIGTWAKVEGRTLIGTDSGDPNFDGIGEEGGAKNHVHTNSLSVDSGGSHTHTVPNSGYGQTQGGETSLPSPTQSGRLLSGSGKTESGERFESIAYANNVPSTSTHSGHTHNMSGDINLASNLPPYRAVNIWRRTA